MDKANIIISIIIVICIAAAVTAYGITNSDNPIFSDLSSMSSKSTAGTGIGNNSSLGNGSSVVSTGTSGSDTGSSGYDSGSGSDTESDGYDSSSSGSDSGSSDSGSGSDSGSSSSSSSSSSSTQLSYSDAQSIADGAIDVEGCYAGSGSYSDGYWYFTIYDANGNDVGIISVNDATGQTGEG